MTETLSKEKVCPSCPRPAMELERTALLILLWLVPVPDPSQYCLTLLGDALFLDCASTLFNVQFKLIRVWNKHILKAQEEIGEWSEPCMEQRNSKYLLNSKVCDQLPADCFHSE